MPVSGRGKCLRETVSNVRVTAELLRRFWGLDGAVVETLGGGINSETWLVKHEGSRFVAKQVAPSALDDLVTGCEVAESLAAAGFVTGPPLSTTDGRVVLKDHRLALLAYVPGRELEGDTDQEQNWIASTLAGVHVAGGPLMGPSASEFMTDWLTTDLPGVAAHPWLVRVVDQVRAETDFLRVTWSMLHTDPSPEAFRHDAATGITGIVDWTGARRGPVLYDVASAVMYLGGTEHATKFLATYTARGPLTQDELRHLDSFRRFREAIQGTYFAWRLAANDLTGGIDQAANEKGLNDARRRIGALGLANE